MIDTRNNDKENAKIIFFIVAVFKGD